MLISGGGLAGVSMFCEKKSISGGGLAGVGRITDIIYVLKRAAVRNMLKDFKIISRNNIGVSDDV